MENESVISTVDTGTEGVSTPPQPQVDTEAQRKITELGQAASEAKRAWLQESDKTAAQAQRIAQLEAIVYQKQQVQPEDPKEMMYEDPDKALNIAHKQGAASVIESLRPVINDVGMRLQATQSRIDQQEFYDTYNDLKACVKHPDIGRSAKNIVLEVSKEVYDDVLNRGLTQEQIFDKVAKSSRIRIQRELKPIDETVSPMHSGGGSTSDGINSKESDESPEEALAQVMSLRGRMRG